MAGLFDLFSADSGKAAAGRANQATVQGINQGYGSVRNALGNERDIYNTAQRKSVGAINTGYGTARGDITAGRDQALGYIDQGTNQAAGQFNQALGTYGELYPGAVSGYNAYGDAVGVGGQEGYDRATQNFRTNPGYEFQRAQGEEALLRNANARGMLSSGNTSQDLLDYSQGLADQSYQQYVGNLSPYLNLAPQLAGAQSDLYSQLAGLYSNQGVNKANIATGAGRNLADLATGRAGDLASVYQNTAGRVGGTYDDLAHYGSAAANARGQANAQLVQDQYAAEQGAAQNQYGALMALLSGGTQAAGYFL